MPKKKKPVDPAVSAAASALGKRSGVNMTAKQRKERATKASLAAREAVTPEQLKERNSKAGKSSWEAKTPEQKAEHLKKLAEGRKRAAKRKTKENSVEDNSLIQKKLFE